MARPLPSLIFERSVIMAFFLGLMTLGSAAPAAADPEARVDTGVLRGTSDGRIARFEGVPFARPPIGNLRWRPPEAPTPWTGVRPADRYGPICMQKPSRDNGVGPGPASEDCLTLNVFTQVSAPAGALPVMVWIHGGGFVNGSGTAALYDGGALAAQGVVVVTLNYRLGRFGFFAHPALTAEASGAPLANYGLLDQIAALKWVRRNIAAFGGDPLNVTVFGESAGGMSVNRLMMIPEASALFQKAVSESGLGREQSLDLRSAEAAGVRFIAGVHGPAGDDAAAAAGLRALPAAEILAGGDLDVGRGEAPILDGRLLKETPIAAFAAGREAKVPYLVGSNTLELPAAFTPTSLKSKIALSPQARSKAVLAYASASRLDERLATDVLFTEPARALARLHAASGSTTYLYRFGVVSAAAPIKTGAIHASDRQYIFKTLEASPWPTDARDAALAETISAYVVAFAKSGDPNGDGRPVWPRYGPSDALMAFTNDGPRPGPTPDASELSALEPTPGPAGPSR